MDQIGGLLTRFYVFAGLLLFVMAAFLPLEWPVNQWVTNKFGIAVAPVLGLAAFALIFSTNLRVVHADIVEDGGSIRQRYTMACSHTAV